MSDQDYLDQFTERAKKVMSLAEEEARRFNHNYIGTEHLLLGLVGEGEGVAAKVLSNFGVDLNTVRGSVEYIVGRDDRIVLGEIGLTPRARKVIELARDEARRLNHAYIGTEHLLLGLVRHADGIAIGILESLGVNLEKVRTRTIQILSQAPRTASATLPVTAKDAPRSIEEASDDFEASDAFKEAIKKLEAILNEKEAAIQRQGYRLAAELRDREVKMKDHIAWLEANWRREEKNKQSFEG